MKTIGVILNPAKEKAEESLVQLASAAKQLGASLYACQSFAKGVECVDRDDFCNIVEAVITLGGDGTLLEAAQILKDKPLPVLGVNLGRLGFLTNVSGEDLEKGLEALVSDRFETSKRVMLDGSILRGGKSNGEHIRALNDIVIGWGQSTRIVTLDVAINDEPVTSYRCDGIIVSTPTGSTGHSLSAGGPIIHPEDSSLLINVICPHTLSARPLVVPNSAEIRITVTQTGKRLLLSHDGQDGEPLSDGDALIIRKAEHAFHLVHLPGYEYFSVLRKKLQWSGSSA